MGLFAGFATYLLRNVSKAYFRSIGGYLHVALPGEALGEKPRLTKVGR